MATRKTTSRTSSKRGGAAARTGRRSSRTTRATGSSTARRAPTGRLYPRRRRSRPGLPTTVGTALGTLVVTTLLDLSWPVRLGLIALVVVVGLAYVLWRHGAEIRAAAEGPEAQPDRGADGAPAAEPPEQN